MIKYGNKILSVLQHVAVRFQVFPLPQIIDPQKKSFISVFDIHSN